MGMFKEYEIEFFHDELRKFVKVKAICKTAEVGMSEKVELKYKSFDGMVWPVPNTNIEHILRYGNPEEILCNRVSVASIVSAYTSLVKKNQKDRNYICKKIQESENE